MPGPPSIPGVGEHQELRLLAERTTSSPHFQKAPSLRNLLIFLCEKTLSGDSENLREQDIGVRVFGRREGYETSEDNIVRVQVSQLRKRLQMHFSEDGRHEPVIIDIPRGRYEVVFLRRQAPPASPVKPAEWPFRAALSAAFILAAVCMGLLWRNRQVAVDADPLASKPSLAAFWPLLFQANQQTDIVLSDSTMGAYQDATGETYRLNDYLNRTYLRAFESPTDASLERRFANRALARVAAEVVDAEIVRKISILNYRSQARVVLLSARQFQTANAKDHNVILIGGRRSNLWTELFERDLNFQIRYEAPTRTVVNSKPLEGEQSVYSLRADSGESIDDYGLVAHLPNLRRTGSVLLISGTGRVGLEAGGELLTDETLLAQIWRPPSSDPQHRFPYFEALLHARRTGGAATKIRISASRITPR